MMITEDRLNEMLAAPREAYIAKAEIAELIAAYRGRTPGLTVTKGSDGTWLNFVAPDGSAASIKAGCLSAERGPIAGRAILKWADAVPNAG